MRHPLSSTVLGLAIASGVAGCAQPETAAPARPYAVQQTDWRQVLWSLYEKTLIDAINEARGKKGLPALVHVEKLRGVARAHSLDMATRLYSTHVSPNGKGPADRLKAAGVPYSRQGELLRMIAPQTSIPMHWVMNEPTVGWMNNAAQRAQILDPKFTRFGVGVKEATSGRIYATVILLTP